MELSYSFFLCVLVTAVLASVAQSQNCNICGDGNSIQYPQGVVEFVYDGVERKNNCETWQEIVKNPVAISDDFCRNEMIKYTAVPCRCTTPNGFAVTVSPTPPAKSPAPNPATTVGSVAVDSGPSSAAVPAPTSSLSPVAESQVCNICGNGNSIQFPQGVVEFVYNGVERKNNCETWQEIVKNPVAISDDFCRNEMIKYTAVPCRCTTPSGDAVTVSMTPPSTMVPTQAKVTKSPTKTPTFAPATSAPTKLPTVAPVMSTPSNKPSQIPSTSPTTVPSSTPSEDAVTISVNPPATTVGSVAVGSAPSSEAVPAPISSNSEYVNRCEQLSNSTARCNDTPSSTSNAKSLQSSVMIWILLCSAVIAAFEAV
jgi:hypothetical protein